MFWWCGIRYSQHCFICLSYTDDLPPVDFVTEVDELQIISFGVFVFVTFMASLGIIFSVFLMIFNIMYRKVRYGKLWVSFLMIFKIMHRNIRYRKLSVSVIILISVSSYHVASCTTDKTCIMKFSAELISNLPPKIYWLSRTQIFLMHHNKRYLISARLILRYWAK